MLEIDRSVSAAVEAPPERCLELLADVERYPSWSSLIDSVAREGELVRMRASVLGVGLEMTCSLALSPAGAVLRRVPHGPDDGERYEAAWSVAPALVELRVQAALEAPGPARLIRGRVERAIADGLLADFVRAL